MLDLNRALLLLFWGGWREGELQLPYPYYLKGQGGPLYSNWGSAVRNRLVLPPLLSMLLPLPVLGLPLLLLIRMLLSQSLGLALKLAQMQLFLEHVQMTLTH